MHSQHFTSYKAVPEFARPLEMLVLLFLAALAALQQIHALKVCVRAGLMPLSNCTLPGPLKVDHGHNPEQYMPEDFAG